MRRGWPKDLRRVVEFRLRIAGEPVTLFEDLVDLVNCPLAEARRPARAQRAPAFRTALFLGTGLPEREPHRVAGDVLNRIHDGHQAADEMGSTDHAVIDGSLLDDGRGG